MKFKFKFKIKITINKRSSKNLTFYFIKYIIQYRDISVAVFYFKSNLLEPKLLYGTGTGIID